MLTEGLHAKRNLLIMLGEAIRQLGGELKLPEKVWETSKAPTIEVRVDSANCAYILSVESNEVSDD